METQAETEVTVGSLGDKPKRGAIPAASYEAVYQGLKVFIDDSPWGKKKVVKLAFKITAGPHTDTVVYYKGSMFKLDSGDYVIGDKSELATRIMAITGGAKTLGENNKGTRVLIGVKNQTSKKNGNVYDFVDTVLQMPGGAAAAAPRPAAATAPAAAQAPAAQPAQPNLPTAAPKAANDNLLDDLADLSDFEDAK